MLATILVSCMTTFIDMGKVKGMLLWALLFISTAEGRKYLGCYGTSDLRDNPGQAITNDNRRNSPEWYMF